MEDVAFYITKENSWCQESFKDIITYFRVGPNEEGKIKRVGEREVVSWKRAGVLIGEASLEWMGTHSTVNAEKKIRTPTDVGRYGSIWGTSSDTFCFCLSSDEC